MNDSGLPFELRDFVATTPWIFAKTYAKTWPHEYIVRDRVDEKPIIYFDHDGMVYWTMGAPIEETTIVNRCVKEQSYEYKRDHGLLPEKASEDSA
jgi:hypothetical protein